MIAYHAIVIIKLKYHKIHFWPNDQITFYLSIYGRTLTPDKELAHMNIPPPDLSRPKFRMTILKRFYL